IFDTIENVEARLLRLLRHSETKERQRRTHRPRSAHPECQRLRLGGPVEFYDFRRKCWVAACKSLDLKLESGVRHLGHAWPYELEVTKHGSRNLVQVTD